MYGLTRRRNAGDEARRRGGLRIKFDYLGIFIVCRNLVHTGVFAFRLHQKCGRRSRVSKPRPSAQQRYALATEPPLRGNLSRYQEIMNIVNGIMRIYLSQPDAVCTNITVHIVLGPGRRQATQDVALNAENMPKVQNTISCHIKLRKQNRL